MRAGWAAAGRSPPRNGETSRDSPLAEVTGGRRNPWTMLREFAPPQDWPGPMILLIDEAQGMTGDMSNGESSLLKALHEGRHGFPLTAVLSGLSDTLQVLRTLGVSRLSEGAALALGPLPSVKCGEAVDSLLDRHRVAGTAKVRAEWAAAVAERCKGWPQHLHNYLAGAARSLVEASGDLSRADPGAVLDHGDRARVNYYNPRRRACSSILPGTRGPRCTVRPPPRSAHGATSIPSASPSRSAFSASHGVKSLASSGQTFRMSTGESTPIPSMRHSPPAASNTSPTFTVNPGRAGELARSPRSYTPCVTYPASPSARTVMVCVSGSTIQYSGIAASA